MENIVQEQFYLARKANIGLLESSLLPDFERIAMVNLLLKDVEEEEKRKAKQFGNLRF